MAKAKGRKQHNRVRRGRGRWVLPALLIAIVGIGGFFAWMHLNASLVHLKYADVYLEDLPSQFEETKIIFISDVNIRNASDAAACETLMDKLQELDADMLILGGDYSADTVFDALNGGSSGENEAHAEKFIQSLGDFYAPLGKFAVSGENDGDAIASAFASVGVQHLADVCATVEKDGAQLVIAGLSDNSKGRTPYEEIGGYFSGDECVIAIAHNPSAYIGVRVAEARSGGAWADMVLSGHTLGGQIKLFGRTMRTLPDEEARCIAGWYYSDDLPMLVSQGLGCRDVKLRLGTQSEVWLLTLRRPQENNRFLPDF